MDNDYTLIPRVLGPSKDDCRQAYGARMLRKILALSMPPTDVINLSLGHRALRFLSPGQPLVKRTPPPWSL